MIMDNEGRTLQARAGQIFDPFTIRPAANGRFSRLALPGNIVPASRIDPVARKILAFYPAANQPGTADFRQNYFTTQKIRRSNRNFLGRLDHSFNDKHRMFVRYTQNYQFDTTVQFEGGATGTIAEQPGRGVAIDDVYTFSPTLIMNTRYSVSHQTPIAGRLTNGFDLTSLGFSSALVNEIKTKNNFAGVSFPVINITNYTTIGQDGGNQRSIYYHVFGNTITKIINSHSLKFGGEYRLQRENGFGYGNVAPTFTFAEAYTRGPLDNSPVAPIGHGLASFLLGVPTAGSVTINASRALQAGFGAGFVHDDWRINKRLTINAGIRYELEGAPTERFNRALLGFDPTLESPIAAQALTNYRANPIAELPVANFKTTGGLIFAGTGGQPRAQYTRDKNNWMPRLGMAFSLNSKTVLRAGIGVYFDTVGIDRDDGSQLGFSQSTPLIPTNNNGQTYVASLSNPFPNGFQTPTGAALGVRTFLGRGINASTNPFVQGTPLNSYNTRWSMAVQRELPGRLVAEITYVGSRANKLGLTRSLNALPLQYLSTKTERDQAAIDFLGAQVRNPFLGIADFVGTPLGNQTVTRSQLLRPFPHFQDIFINESSGYAWYHSMQAGVEKRLTKGLTFQASLTWSKFMQATEFLNEADLRPAEVISDQDYPWRFAINGIYELPFGKGKKFLGNANRLVDGLLGGWQFQGWFEGQSGEALGFGNAILRGNIRDMNIPVGQRTTDCWFRSGVVTTAISCPWKGAPVFETDPAKQLGSNLRTLPLRFSYLRADGTNNFDLSLFKNYQITEKFKVQFRAESFNALNHVQFANPVTGIQNTALGTITAEKGHGQRQWTFGLKLMF